MFRNNKQHLQWPLFSSIDALSKKQQVRLEQSWAGTFYHEYFSRINEQPFAVLYADVDSRPNIPVNVLIGWEALKAGFGWSDEEAYDHFYFDLQVRYALGYRDLSAGSFSLRTVYNFRQRLTHYMQENGENLVEQAFEQVTDEQISAFALRTTKLRMDSTFIAGNIRETTRLQLLVEVLQRTQRMLDAADRESYSTDFAPYLKGSSGQYIYGLKRTAYKEHMQPIGELMQRLVQELASQYSDETAYRVLARVFQEHFNVEDSNVQVKEACTLSSASLQSPDDWEATYRRKRGERHRGYIINISETCDPQNDFQLIVKVQTEPNNTDDEAMLKCALPDLAERTDVNEIHTDGGYNGPEIDQELHDQKVVLVQSSIRGRTPAKDRLGLEDFQWEMNAESNEPEAVTCAYQQRAVITAGRKSGRYRAAFDSGICDDCPLRAQCPGESLKSRPENVIRFSRQDVNVALRRQRSHDERTAEHHLRPAVEATMREVKHQFGNGKVPVRGKPRVSMLMLASAMMCNVRRIHRYQRSQEETIDTETGNPIPQKRAIRQPVGAFFASLRTWLSTISRPLRLSRTVCPCFS